MSIGIDEEYFDLPPHQKGWVKEEMKMIYGLDISDEDVERIQRREPLVNFYWRQRDYLRRSLVIEKFCTPILQEARRNASPNAKKFFDSSLIQPYFEEAQKCFRSGLFLSTISLCRSSLDVCLRETVA